MPLKPKQRDFVAHPATIASEISIGTHHAMARHDEADRVPPYCPTNSLRRIDFQAFRNITIGHRLAKRDSAHDFRNCLAEWSETVHAIGWREIGLAT